MCSTTLIFYILSIYLIIYASLHNRVLEYPLGVNKRHFFFIDHCDQLADVWSCGVTLYVMLVGAYPFEDPDDPKNFRKTIGVKFFLTTGFDLSHH